MINHTSSFRDPACQVFYESGRLKRFVFSSYLSDYNHFINSGLYNRLISENLIIPHEEEINSKGDLILVPQLIPFISYPYEWSFSQYKLAALTTLKISLIALEFGMILKDASAYNVQFSGNKCLFIDTTSFEIFNPIVARNMYRQFCRHFLGPLLLMKYCDVRLNTMMQLYIDGIPLDLLSNLLPIQSFFNIIALIHIHSNKFISHRKKISEYRNVGFNKKQYYNIIKLLSHNLEGVKPKRHKSYWNDYYQSCSYKEESEYNKVNIVNQMVSILDIKNAVDIGANDGKYSNFLSQKGIYVVSLDFDSEVVEANFKNCNTYNNRNILPLCINYVNPSPPIGWNNQERLSFLERCHFDLALALAITHHLYITFDISFKMQAKNFSKIAKYLIIEFVGEDDEKVIQISKGKTNRLQNYNLNNFLNSYLQFFNIVSDQTIVNSNRKIFLFETKNI